MSLAPSLPPSRPHVARRVAALLTAALALALTGCTQTGFKAQTNASYDPGVGTNEAFGEIPVLAVLVVDNGNQTGTLSATLTRRTDTEVALTDVTATTIAEEGEEEEEIQVRFGGEVEIPSNTEAEPLVLTEEDNPTLLTGEAVEAGRFLSVTFAFSNGQSVTLDAPVVHRPEEGELYADVPGESDSSAPPSSG